MDKTAQELASKGRYGDSMLVHMAPEEVAGIASLIPGGITNNPETGLPEMFKFKDFLKFAAPIGLSIAMPYFAPKIATGLGAGSGLTQFLGGTAGRAIMAGAGTAIGGLLTGANKQEALSSGLTAGLTYGLASKAGQAMKGADQTVTTDPTKTQVVRETGADAINQVNTYNPSNPSSAASFGLAAEKPLYTVGDTVTTAPQGPGIIDRLGGYGNVVPGALAATAGTMMGRSPEEQEAIRRRRRKEIELARPYSDPVSYPGAGYGSGEYGYFGPGYGLYAKEGGHIKQMQEGGIVDAAPALAPPPSPSELGLGEPPAPVENVGIAASMPEEIQTTTVQDILPSSPSPVFMENVPASAFQGNLMSFAPGILGGARYGMGAMPAARPVNTTEFGYDVFNPNIRGYDYRSFVPQDYQSPVGTGSAPSVGIGAGTGSGEQVTGSPNVIADTKKASGSRSTSTFKPYTKYTSFSELGERANIPGQSNRVFRDVISGYTGSGEPIYTRETRYTVPGYNPYSDSSGKGQFRYGTRPIKFQEGGVASLPQTDSLPQTEGQVEGDGDGMSDEVYGDIENEQEVALSKDEFIVPADVVAGLGNGSSNAGASKLYEMMDRVRMARTGKKTQPPEIEAEEFMPA